MGFIADTHVHIYDQYRLTPMLEGAERRMQRLGEENYGKGVNFQKFLCLTERNTENYFRSILSSPPSGFRVLPTSENNSLRIELDHGRSLFLIAGRQMNTRERLEVTGLGLLECAPAGLSLEETVGWIGSRGGIPVLNWSLGKWWGERGAYVTRFLELSTKEKYLLGDVLMRPRFSRPPAAFQIAKDRNIGVIAGSDPLPMSGEEDLIGRYVTWGRSILSEATPWKELSTVLLEKPTGFEKGGQRGSYTDLVRRSFRYRLQAKQQKS